MSAASPSSPQPLQGAQPDVGVHHGQSEGAMLEGAVTARTLLAAEERLTMGTVAALYGNELVDLHTPLDGAASSMATALVPLDAESPQALEIIRHSTAHVMASAVQRLFPGTQVTFGPATENGFYYDFDRPAGSFSEEELARIEAEMLRIIETDAPFEREVLSKEAARALLTDLGEHYKLEHLERLEDPISVYRVGGWVDLCRGPHVPSTRFLKAFKLTAVAGAYWRGDERNPMLQRIYGTAFPSAKSLRIHLQQLELAKARDHRKLGRELELFAFLDSAPASPVFLPRGATVYSELVNYLRGLYLRDGYTEVMTPELFDRKLFETSGHLPSYADNMYFGMTRDDKVENVDDARLCLKPMNCPAHAAIYGLKRRSYRELPLRLADFGRLHRYERSGVVHGITRVRSFCQDDGHIFCTQEQGAGEISRFIDLVTAVYRDFAFSEMRVIVATRPDKRIGSDDVWEAAERMLLDSVIAKGIAHEVAEGEGAFYGPKIEFHLKDALSRSWQLGTIQADFNLPERFDLTYVGADNLPHRPIMLHRALLGSLERFLGVLIEHCGGAFPAWLAPEQIVIASVAAPFAEAAEARAQALRTLGIRAIADSSDNKLGAKIRSARLLRVPFIGVLGEQEAQGGGLSLRRREEGKDLGLLPWDTVVSTLQSALAPPSATV